MKSLLKKLIILMLDIGNLMLDMDNGRLIFIFYEYMQQLILITIF